MAERIHMNGDAARHIQAYLEYEQIVGTDDGGKLMSEAEFEEYKARVREKRANRLYVHWRNMETGADCKAIGPASQCFCGHRFKEHMFDNVEDKNVHCKDRKCKCKLFSYIPVCKYAFHQFNENLCSWIARLQVHVQAFVPRALASVAKVHSAQLQVRPLHVSTCLLLRPGLQRT